MYLVGINNIHRDSFCFRKTMPLILSKLYYSRKEIPKNDYIILKAGQKSVSEILWLESSLFLDNLSISRSVVSDSWWPHGCYNPQASLSMEFFRQKYCSGLPRPSPGDLPNLGIKPWSPALKADSLPDIHLSDNISNVHFQQTHIDASE